ncbi:uncharacterized protein LOC111271753 isoform X1 [Varroa jacobsoni]|uniref:F-box domain-containing protein n=2 Tax=Varroa TaxID=62624 RepID=A0A7M7JUU3_VARDE|nr:uncharacterized protein LOC111248254 [Varroa destructor]XP_022708466.1 uncharacterized protein LOC111271753 isoform X1 [Varroa jacobsoni]
MPNLLDLPDELVGLILQHCLSRDVLAVANTCSRLCKVANDVFLWQHLCERELAASGLQLEMPLTKPALVRPEAGSSSAASGLDSYRCDGCLSDLTFGSTKYRYPPPMQFPPSNCSPDSQQHDYQSREGCSGGHSLSAHQREQQMTVEHLKKRLQRLHRVLPKVAPCKTCKQLTCLQEPFCHENRVVLDVGSKTTWCLGPTTMWQKHPSVMLADSRGHCLPCEFAERLKPQSMLFTRFHGGSIARPHAHAHSHAHHAHGHYQALLMLPHHYAAATSVRAPHENLASSFANLRIESRSVFDDMSNIIKNINPDSYLRHPLKCLQGERDEGDGAFGGGCTVFEDFVSHILTKFQLTNALRQANSSLVFCEPHFMTTRQRRKLAKFFFETTGTGRLCFLNKAYSTANLTQIQTCIVVDSGCHNTVVTVIINGQVQPERTQHCPVGGQLLSEHLLDCLRMRQWDCPVSCEGLDYHHVKLSCHLSPNIDMEHTAVYDEVFKQCFVHCQRGGNLTQEWVEFGSELYTAPELMYTRMQLPDMILRAVQGLTRCQIQELVTHILLTGANTELAGFRRRLVSDLRRRMPDFAHLNMHTYSGSRSWECCMGGTCLLLANTYDPMTMFPVSSHVSHTYQWVTREAYILHGEAAVKDD